MTEPAPPAARRRPRTAAETVPPPAAPAPSGDPAVPYLLDFYPREGPSETRLTPFFETLRRGRLSTTRCRRDGALLWPPRLACPRCHTSDLEWIDLPGTGHVYAFSAVLAGAPLGMERDVPLVVGLVDLDGVPMRIFGRIVGRPWTECRVGLPVTVEPFDVPGGRVFYRFRATPSDA
ncbi:MAG TPA: Zn-ribbon domain-containing OB-fold protein [Thermoplasmata archaeon]|nr:Zn-ribbon domain-containing OB-fold protein [Thermoplasmata archaeon]